MHKVFKTSQTLIIAIACHAFALPLFAHTPAEEMAEAAGNLLAALTPAQKEKVAFDFKSDERLNWHFIPKERKGLPLKEMTPAQQHLAHALLNTALSQR